MNYSTDDEFDERYTFSDYCADRMAEEEPEPDDEPEEPECECAMSGDSYDPRGCELHDSSSSWNVRMSAIREDAAALVAPILPQLEAVEERKREAGRADLLCHFSGCGIWVNERCDCMYGKVA